MIMFYQSIYGLRANKLSKFSPGCAAEGRSDGEYYKAYYEVVSQIKPKSDKTPVITPHIDRNGILYLHCRIWTRRIRDVRKEKFTGHLHLELSVIWFAIVRFQKENIYID